MGDESLHPMFQEMLKRTDGWTDNVNESSLDYDFIKRHPHLSITFLTFTGIAVAAGNIGNVLVNLLSPSPSPPLSLLPAMIPLNLSINEPRHEKTCLRGLRLGKTQTSLLS